MKKSIQSCTESRADVSYFSRQLLADTSTEIRNDFAKILSVVQVMANRNIELERKLRLCNKNAERNNMMYLQYKELFEQEQNKVFELIAEKACWFKEYELSSCSIEQPLGD